MSFQVLAVRESLLALITNERLWLINFVTQFMRSQLVKFDETFPTAWEVAGKRFESLVSQHVLKKVFTEAEKF